MKSQAYVTYFGTAHNMDIQLTDRITKAGQILGIKLLDHIIIAWAATVLAKPGGCRKGSFSMVGISL